MQLTRKFISLVAFIAAAAFCQAEHNSSQTDNNNTRPEALTLIDNSLASGATLKKRFIGIYFMTNWCPACRQFTPKVDDLYEEYGDELDMIIVNLDDNRDYVRHISSKYDIPFLTVKQKKKESITKHFNIRTVPTFILVNESGEKMTRKDWKTRNK